MADADQLRGLLALCEAAAAGAGMRAEPAGISVTIFHELFCALVEGLHTTWMCMCHEQATNLMDFPRALHEIHVAHADFWCRSVAGPEDFQALAARPSQDGAERVLAWLREQLLRDAGEWLLAALCKVQAELRYLMSEKQSSARDHKSVEPMLDPTSRRGSYQPPTLPEMEAREVARGAAHVCSSGPRAAPAGEVDIDAALRALGIDVDEPQIMDAAGPDLSNFLDSCTESWACRESEASCTKPGGQNLDAFLDSCLDVKQGHRAGLASVESASLDGLWD